MTSERSDPDLTRVRPLPGRTPWIADRLKRRQPMVEAAMRASFDLPGDPSLPLYRMMRCHLGWVDAAGEERPGPPPDRLLGMLCIEAAASQTRDAYDWEPDGSQAEAERLQEAAARRSRECAAAIELMGASVAAHEDLQTAAQQRNGQDALWSVWGPAQAINAGDGLHALARLTLLNAPQDDADAALTLAALTELDNAAMAYYQGQHQDLQMQERVDVREEQYLAMARGKHGALAGAAMAMGALAGGAGSALADHWRDAGVALGTAAAMARDYREVWGIGEAESGRALNKSKLYPVVVGLQHGTLTQKRALGALYFKRVMEPGDMDAVREILDDKLILRRMRDALDVEMRKIIKSIENDLTILAIDDWGEVFHAIVGEPQ